jgi:hypothetical protein
MFGFGKSRKKALSDEVHQQITTLCATADDLAKDRKFPAALTLYWQAYDLLPELKTQWEAATWIFAAIGDANFLSGDYQAGRDNLTSAMHCPDAIGNPFIHMRLGQCQYELGNLDRAADELARAFLLEGAGLFAEEDPKYVRFVKERLNEPPGGWDA